MGEGKRRQFGLLHRELLCIFCGGIAPASTGVHQPDRAFFDVKHAPEGDEYPACAPCNKKSREYVLTALVEGRRGAECPAIRVSYADRAGSL